MAWGFTELRSDPISQIPDRRAKSRTRRVRQQRQTGGAGPPVRAVGRRHWAPSGIPGNAIVLVRGNAILRLGEGGSAASRGRPDGPGGTVGTRAGDAEEGPSGARRSADRRPAGSAPGRPPPSEGVRATAVAPAGCRRGARQARAAPPALPPARVRGTPSPPARPADASAADGRRVDTSGRGACGARPRGARGGRRTAREAPSLGAGGSAQGHLTRLPLVVRQHRRPPRFSKIGSPPHLCVNCPKSCCSARRAKTSFDGRR